MPAQAKRRQHARSQKAFFRLSPSDYEGLHRRYKAILNLHPKNLPISTTPVLSASAESKDPQNSESPENPLFEQLSHRFQSLMRALYAQKGATLEISILESSQAQDFITAHAAVLDSAFQATPMSDAMRQRLQRSDYIFSGIKTFHELNEAFPLIFDSNGIRKPFEQFLKEVRAIDRTYNRTYLQAEYNFVVSSASMAAKWEEFMKDGDRYNLQYRTAGDDRVRPEHAALHGVTLPPSDPFWEEYYPPNGWNCRCTVVQVRKSKYPATPHDEAIALGELATQKDPKGIFRFNPGKEKKTFPDYNPYTIRRCRDCDIAKGKLKLARFVPENEVCDACKFIRALLEDNIGASRRIVRYKEEEWERTYISPNDNGLVATQWERIAESEASNSERQKFVKEMRMCKVLADNGHDVEYLQGVNRPAGQTYDIRMDGIKADLKCITGGAGNIVKYIKKALTKQGGEAVVLEIPSHAPEYYGALTEARKKCNGRIFFYFSDDLELKEIKK